MKTDPAGRDPDAAITALAREVAAKETGEPCMGDVCGECGKTYGRHCGTYCDWPTQERRFVSPMVAHIAAALIAVRDETQLAMLRVPFHGKDVKPDGPYALISDLQEAMKGTREPDRT